MKGKPQPQRTNYDRGLYPSKLRNKLKGPPEIDPDELPLADATRDKYLDSDLDWYPCPDSTIRKFATALSASKTLEDIVAIEDEISGPDPESISATPTEREARYPDETPFSESKITEFLKAGTYASASCCAFLAGDFSVCQTGHAFITPTRAQVHVTIHDHHRVWVNLYEAGIGRWFYNHDGSLRINTRLNSLFHGPPFDFSPLEPREQIVARTFFDTFPQFCKPIYVTVVLETPINLGICEESAVVVALARALLKHFAHKSNKEVYDPGNFDVLKLAALLYSSWCNDVSWATIVASAYEHLPKTKVLHFDRTKHSGHATLLLEMLADPQLKSPQAADHFRSNLCVAEGFWNLEAVDLRDSEVSLWRVDDWHSPHNILDLYSGLAPALTAAPFIHLFQHLTPIIRGDNTTRIALLVQMHQTCLEFAGFVQHMVHETLASVSRVDGVLAVKLAAPRGIGALLVFGRAGSSRKMKRAMQDLDIKPLDDLRQALHLATRR